MSSKNVVLFAVFKTPELVDGTVDIIKKNIKVLNNRIFVFSDVDNNNSKIITFDFSKDNNDININDYLPNCLSIHRKKETNTLYTLNGLNEIIRSELGKLDPKYIVDWKRYRNTFILTHNVNSIKKLKEIRTKLDKIVNV